MKFPFAAATNACEYSLRKDPILSSTSVMCMCIVMDLSSSSAKYNAPFNSCYSLL